jgi:GT2 family glycosyltransferase/glycosyltransferase involved in cell wall biosynthesis
MEAKDEKVITEETAETLRLPFDKFQRYKVVADIINKFRKKKETFKILEVGAGGEETLKKFLPQDNFIFFDTELLPEDRQKSNYILGDITEMHIKESYDFVVSIDTYEHIHPSLRERFINETIHPSTMATIIAAPFDTPGVKESEVIVNEAYVLTYDTEYRWLHEHIENGLPSLSYTLELIEKLELNYTVIPNGYLPRWIELISIYLLTEGMPEFSKIITELNEFYNKNFYQYDSISPAYRQVIIIKKDGQNPDFSDILTKDFNSEDFKIKYEMLQSFLRKIKELYTPYRYNRVKTLENNLQEKERQIHELNAAVQGRNEQILILDGKITEISGHLSELNTAIQGKDGQIRYLNGQITDTSGQLKEKEHLITELNAAAREKDAQLRILDELTITISDYLKEKDKQIRDLEEQITDIAVHQKEKERQIHEFNVAIQGKDEHILNLDGQIANISGQLKEREEGLREIEMVNLRIRSELNSMKSSVTWRTVMKWHSFVEKSMPQGTRRRRYYDLSLTGLRTITNEGWSSFWWKYKQHRSSKKHTEVIAKSTEEKILETAKDKTGLSEKSLDTFMKYKLLNFLSQSGLNLSFPKFDEPVVSIITLTFNKVEFTYQYLESILAHTDIPYELIIVDNGSLDETTSLLDRLENVTTIKNEGNLGFIKGCNQGASKAKGKYLLFLNNDITVTPGWLSKLVRTIEDYPKCGAVGCKLIWPNGKLQEAGSIIWSEGSALGYGREGDPMQPEYSYLREVDYCSGACLLVRKDIFQQLGCFDERYTPAYYEDSDLCIGIWGLGYKVVFQPDAVVFHHEFTSSSFNKATALMVANQSKFVAKRKEALGDKFDPSPNNVLFARDLRQGNRMLVLDDRIPTPYQGSGYPRAYHMLKFLGDLGYKVTFFPLNNTTPWQPYTNELQQLGIEVFYGDNLDFIRFAQDRAGYYDLVLVSRPHNMKKTFDIIKRFFSNAVLLYDAEAMFSIREILKAKVKGIKLKEKDAEHMINGEIDLMNKADLIITVSENEKKMTIEKGDVNNVVVWGHPIDVKNPKNDFYERKDILFVGGFLASESPNEDAVLYFAKEVFPKIQKELSCRFFIVGITPPDSVKKLSTSSVIVTGFVPDLREYYEKCRVFVVPHRYSAGIPWKLQEAMSYGIPSVVSELTASQLDLTDGNEVLIVKNSDEFVHKITKLYQDEKLWHQLQQNALKYIQETCNQETMKTTLNGIIKR